jgi:hypothetical protein
MAEEKITFEQFFEAVDADNKPFVRDLHGYLLDSGCKVAGDADPNLRGADKRLSRFPQYTAARNG